jgi:mannose-6-phosphate isomerase-like protein (cupin superfamily)
MMEHIVQPKEQRRMVETTHLVAADGGRRVHFRALGTRYVVSAGQTAGAFAIVEHELAPRSLGSPMHTHEREDEISHLISGRLGVQIGDQVLHAGPGDTVLKPRGIAHAFWNPGDEPVRFLEVITPAGFEDYFAEVEPLLAGPGAPDAAALGAVMQRYALEMDMGSVPRLVAAHGLTAPAA